jgi:hypothetical protein
MRCSILFNKLNMAKMLMNLSILVH